MDSQRKVGAQDAVVFVRESLKGQEYGIDPVSRDGVHKCVMVCVCDKRSTDGADPKEAKILVEHIRGVLDALKLDNGPSHGEVMMTSGKPPLGIGAVVGILAGKTLK
jgi:hypothetical protein